MAALISNCRAFFFCKQRVRFKGVLKSKVKRVLISDHPEFLSDISRVSNALHISPKSLFNPHIDI